MAEKPLQPKLVVGQTIYMDVHGIGAEHPEDWVRHIITGETKQFFYVLNSNSPRIRKSDMTFSLFGDGERGQALTEEDFAAMVAERKVDGSTGNGWVQ